MKQQIKSIIGWIVYLGVLIGLVYGTPKALSYFLETQYPLATITSGSMWPTLKKGDLIFIKGVKEKGEVQVGDIVVYENPKGFTIHRVIKMNEDTFVTKGDANNIEDSPISYGDLIGKTVEFRGKPIRIPYLGNVSIFLSQFRFREL